MSTKIIRNQYYTSISLHTALSRRCYVHNMSHYCDTIERQSYKITKKRADGLLLSLTG